MADRSGIRIFASETRECRGIIQLTTTPYAGGYKMSQNGKKKSVSDLDNDFAPGMTLTNRDLIVYTEHIVELQYTPNL